MDAARRARLEAAGWRCYDTPEEMFADMWPETEGEAHVAETKRKPRKKKLAASDVNKDAWVVEPEAAPEDKPFCDVAYEHRCHSEPITVLGVEFVPGQIVTYRRLQDVPVEFLEHPELKRAMVQFGVCRIDCLFRYTPLTAHTIKAVYRAAGVARPEISEVVENPTTSDAEPEGGE